MAFNNSWRINMLLQSLVPSFVADAVWPEHRQSWKLHPTSYLDGLRGLASIVVFICHYTEENHPSLIASYGLNLDQSPSSWLQLPFVRIVFSGRPMVHIFFVISGFVLSHKPVKAIHARNPDRCFTILSSSALRRPIRLFGPCVVSTFLVMLMVQRGWLYGPAPTLAEQFWDWKAAVFHGITWPWAWDRDLRPAYDVHLWTIPIEFAHSMLLFLLILALARLRRRVRQAAVLLLAAYFLCCGKWAAFEFIAGLFLAELHLLQGPHPKAWESSSSSSSAETQQLLSLHAPPSSWPRPPLGTIARTALHAAVLAAAVFIGGWPNAGAEDTPGIRRLRALTPDPFAPSSPGAEDPLAAQKFWFAVAAALAVWSCGELRAVRRALEGPVAQYCGRVSYAVYIVHGPVLALFQAAVVGRPGEPARGEVGAEGYRPASPAVGVKALVGGESPVQRTAAWFVGLVILAPVVVWAADVFWRVVDNPMIALGRKLESACLDDGVDEYRPRGQGFALAG